MNITISRTIEALRGYVGMSVPELQRAMDLKPGTYFSRRRGMTPWTAQEVKRAADALGVGVATLYEGLPMAATPSARVTGGYYAMALAA